MEAGALSLDLQNERSDFQPRSLEGARHGPRDVLVTIGSEGDQGRSGSGESHRRGTCLSGRPWQLHRQRGDESPQIDPPQAALLQPSMNVDRNR